MRIEQSLEELPCQALQKRRREITEIEQCERSDIEIEPDIDGKIVRNKNVKSQLSQFLIYRQQ